MIFHSNKNFKFHFSFIIAILSVCSSVAQYDITGISTVWDDAFHEWNVYAFNQEDEEIEGTLRVKWQFRDDAWDEWVFELEDYRAQIRQKYTDGLHQWELRSNLGTVDFKLLWRNDVNQWQLFENGQRFRWKTKFNNDLNDWIFGGDKESIFTVYTIYRDDPRDWEVYSENIDLSMDCQVAMVFISIFYSSPK